MPTSTSSWLLLLNALGIGLGRTEGAAASWRGLRIVRRDATARRKEASALSLLSTWAPARSARLGRALACWRGQAASLRLLGEASEVHRAAESGAGRVHARQLQQLAASSLDSLAASLRSALRSDEAIAYGFSSGEISNEDELLGFFGATSSFRVEESWSEGLVRFLTLWPVRAVLIATLRRGEMPNRVM